MMSHIYSLNKNHPIPSDPLSLGFCPSRLPFSLYSCVLSNLFPSPLFPTTLLGFPLLISRSRTLTLSAIFSNLQLSLFFCVRPWQINLRSTIESYLQLPPRIIPLSPFVCCFLSVFLHLFLLPFPFLELTCFFSSFPPFTRGPCLRFSVRLAMHTLTITLPTHVDTFPTPRSHFLKA